MSRFCVQATWDDVPHLSDEQKRQLWEAIPPHQRDARARGMPVLGAGQIYPVPEELVVCEPFRLPEYWPRAYGLDVGWNRTAAVWGAYDRDSDVVYLWSEHYQGQMPPAVHASAILSRGAWMPGAIDPASRASGQRDGENLLAEYTQLGLWLAAADNAVEAGIHACYQRMANGGLKVFSTLSNWRREFRNYHRDDHGKVVKANDHLMDATRYLIMTGMANAIVEPAVLEEQEFAMRSRWGRDEHTGY